MTTENTTTAARAANKAGRNIIDAVAEAGDKALPTAVEVAEVTMSLDVPTKVVLNQRLIVVASVVGGAALGAGVLWGVSKFRAVRAEKKIQEIVNDGDLSDGMSNVSPR